MKNKPTPIDSKVLAKAFKDLNQPDIDPIELLNSLYHKNNTSFGEYKPRSEAEIILDRAYEHIVSVEYNVSLRWLFYRLLQDGLYTSKSDYNRLKDITAEARKRHYKGWHPDIIADETRQPIIRHGRFSNLEHWVDYMKDKLSVDLDPWINQEYYVEVWFEAKAMIDQFQTLVPDIIPLVPFGGDASIPYKSKIAQRLSEAHDKYGHPIKIIYFGDCDLKGKEIPYNAHKDIQRWSTAEYDFTIGGIIEEQAIAFNLPENFEKPGDYQWESLNDEQARKLINKQLKGLINYKTLSDFNIKQEEATRKVRAIIKNVVL